MSQRARLRPRLGLLPRLLLLLGAAFACAGPARAEVVTHVVVHDAIDVGTMALIERGLRETRAAGGDVIVLEIDTPGGPIDEAVLISRQLEQAAEDGVETVAWVRGGATSAGALITLACERIYMTRTSTIGSALPVTVGPTGIQDIPGETGEKVSSYLRSEFRSRAQANGRSPVLAEAMVEPDIEAREIRVDGERRVVSGLEWDDLRERGAEVQLIRTIVPAGRLLNLTAEEAIGLGIADAQADDMEELLARIGRSEAGVQLVERSRSEHLLALLANFSGALLAAALILGFLEMKAPGFGLPGILSILCLAVLLVGRYMVGLAEIPHIVLVVVGLGFLITELFFLPGMLWPGIVGVLCILGGLLLSALGPGFDLGSEYDQELLVNSAFNLCLVALAALVVMGILSYLLPDTPVLRRLVQAPSTDLPPLGEASKLDAKQATIARVGSPGRAVTALHPVGKVVLDADAFTEFEARAEGEVIDAGTPVEVTEVTTGRLVVRPLGGPKSEPEGTTTT